MAQIKVNKLTFEYEGSSESVFENVSFEIDTNWKLGLIGRNGKGKTTLLKLLLGELEYQGTIINNIPVQYFPIFIGVDRWEEIVITLMEEAFSEYELWKVIRELNYLQLDADILYRKYETLSFGERTKVALAFLFSNENQFLLIDEPTNHLDIDTREVVKKYLQEKKGFILVSHDRDILNS